MHLPPIRRPDEPSSLWRPSTGTVATSGASMTKRPDSPGRPRIGRRWRRFGPGPGPEHAPCGGDRARSLRQRTMVAGLPPAAARPAPRRLRRSPVHPGRRSQSASSRPPRPPGWGPNRVPRSPLLTRTGVIDGPKPTTKGPSALVVRRERRIDVSVQRRHALTLKAGCAPVMTARHDRAQSGMRSGSSRPSSHP